MLGADDATLREREGERLLRREKPSNTTLKIFLQRLILLNAQATYDYERLIS